MLFEMECDAFATKVDGVLVPRGKITFLKDSIRFLEISRRRTPSVNLRSF